MKIRVWKNYVPFKNQLYSFGIFFGFPKGFSGVYLFSKSLDWVLQVCYPTCHIANTKTLTPIQKQTHTYWKKIPQSDTMGRGLWFLYKGQTHRMFWEELECPCQDRKRMQCCSVPCGSQRLDEASPSHGHCTIALTWHRYSSNFASSPGETSHDHRMPKYINTPSVLSRYHLPAGCFNPIWNSNTAA